MSGEALLELRGVFRGFGTDGRRVEVLRDVNLAVQEREFVAVVGYSGSGKTTLLSILAGLLEPERGEVRFRGRRAEGPGPERGVVFQDYALLPWLSAGDNVGLAVDEVYSGWIPARRRAQVERYLGLVKLGAARDKRPHELSGGMRQRVAVARALATEPAVILMDEPFGALDALTRGGLQTEIARIWEEDRRTVVMITNDVDEAILLADRILPLSAGPAATLGPCFPVDLPRPRNPKELDRDPAAKALRREILAWLLGPGSRRSRDAAVRALPSGLAAAGTR
jgi:nitrate/nitrite transport system ATP-binding protein